ncbi:MAG: type II toxin-antitoxin system Phd/YefM family antitoxin [Anaerolineales bacterium]
MRERAWQLHEAKDRFSELVNRALDEGPQVITRRGEEVVVILSKNEYAKLRKSRPSLLNFLRESPLVGAELDLVRDRSRPGDTDL